ncbi:H+-transporting two-sector ATPase, B/B' subunit [Rubellimicrobium mesophilum DSM 19309]|uniref:ATP synthase subunit b n=1 Tax=Rubellimicrobium mesophilum DSM 19309 TaxID=442562 RepID=A0A017HUB2_9RHOB|nr:ATP F0F1 synthase subunit B [Rubellimicrobium mesophilum]EYD77971.1 H+-transporting two-sector ATPase, B/B' subunit [Rubellimicrobium mesophilum DSM 19309]
MKILAIVLAVILAYLALSQVTVHGPFFTLHNPEFIVFLAFALFLGIVLWFGVPRRIAGLLDQRAETIRGELAEARALREEAQALLNSFEHKRREMAEQAERIVVEARAEAERAAAQAREDAARAVQRRIASAEEQIAAAEAKAIREVKDRAVVAAVAAAQEVLATQMTPAQASRLVDESIATVGAKLH